MLQEEQELNVSYVSGAKTSPSHARVDQTALDSNVSVKVGWLGRVRGICVVTLVLPQAMLSSVRPCSKRVEQARLALLVLITSCCCYVAGATTVAAQTPGLYYNYYNSGISPTPITGMPDWSRLTAAGSNFSAGITGNIGDPQLSTSDTYCGGYYYGYLYLTVDGSTTPYLLGVQSKDGFSLIIDGTTTIAQNSKTK